MSVFTKYLLLWFPMLFIAILNGTLREFVFRKFTGELTAHQLSTITLLLFFSIYIHFVVTKIPPGSSLNALLIGLLWVVLTLLFEFGFGRYRGNSWETLLHDYNLVKGRIWLLIPVWVAIAPYLFYKLRN
ncbi:MAG: hypothetical protein U0T11_06440 [Chitinophagaceae bacterium]